MSNVKTIFKTPWFTLESEEYENLPALGGKPIYRLNVPDSVVMVVFTEANKLVLVRQFRPVVQRTLLEIPAGGVGGTESPLDAARRELLEETGFICKNLRFVGNVFVSADRIKNNIHVFFGEGAKRDFNFLKEDGVEVCEMSVRDLKKLVEQEEFQQVGGLGVLLFVKWKLAPAVLFDL